MYKVIIIVLIIYVLKSFQQNLGFIYPYLVFYQNNEGNGQELYLIRLDKIIQTEQILSQKEQKSTNSYLKESYQLLKESFKIPLKQMDIENIKLKDNSIIIFQKGHKKYKIFMQNYHLYLYHKYKQDGYSYSALEYPESNVLLSQDINSRDDTQFLFDMEEYKQAFLKIAIFQNITHFYFNLDLEYNQDVGQKNRFQYCFLKKYSVKDDIKQLLIVKNSNKELINAVIISASQFFVYTISEKEHKLILDYNVLSIKPPSRIESLFVDHILLVYQNSNYNISNAGRPQYELKIMNISNSFLSYNITKEHLYYYAIINQKVIACNNFSCDVYNRYNQVIKTIYLSQFQENQQQILQIHKIQLIRFPIDKLAYKYISSLIFHFKNKKIFKTPFCPNERFIQDSEIRMNNENKSFVCEPQSNFIFIQPERCKNLNIEGCVNHEQCFWNSTITKCQMKSNQIKKLFQQQVYKHKNSFIEYYSQYEYGRDSTFKNSSVCGSNFNEITATILIPNRNDAECYYYRALDTYSQYRINWGNQDIDSDITICETLMNQRFQLNCHADKQSMNIPLNLYINANSYILIYFKVNKKNQGAPEFIEVFVTNTELENFAKATRILSIIFITFLCIIIFLVAIKLLRKKIKLICVYYGILEYTPSDKYPLEFLELKILIKQYKLKKYIKQYKFQAQIQNSKFSTDQNNIHECSFCLAELLNNQKIFELYCNHKYHKACLSDWLRSERNSNKCPICKRNFNQVEYNLFESNQRVSQNQMI